MLPKQKTFLDELAALFKKYHIDSVSIKKYHIDSVMNEHDLIQFDSNGMNLSFRSYYISYEGVGMFYDVVSTQDYSPEDPPEVYSGEENFDD